MIQVDYEQGNQNKMYEDALLGFVLIDPEKMLEVSEILPSPEYFRDPTNRAAYSIFLRLFNEDRFPADPALTIKELYTGGEKQHFETMEQAARYVNSLLNAPINTTKFNAAGYREYAEQIKWEKDRGDIRNMAVETLAEIDRVAYDDREEFIGGIESRLGDITMAVHGKEGLKHISEMTDEITEQIETLRGGSPLAAGVPTGIPSLDKTLNGLKGGEVCVLAARPACGKSLVNWVIIPTPKGPVQMGDLKVGDYVFDRFGKPTKVLGVYPQGELDVYEITLKDGRKTYCSEDHIWAYWQNTRRQNKPTHVINTITVKEMLERGIHIIKPSEVGTNRKRRCRFAIPSNGAVEYSEKEYEIPPFIMGIFLGDGCKNANGDFELSSSDEESVAKVAELIGAKDYRQQKGSYSWNFYKEPYVKGSRSNTRIKIKDLATNYETLLSGILCGEKHIPDEYKYGSIEQRIELLQGIFDADGSVLVPRGNRNLQAVFSTSSEKLCDDVREVLFSLGIGSSKSVQDRRGQIHRTHGKEYVRKSIDYEARILTDDANKADLFSLSRKKEICENGAKADSHRHYDRIQITDIKALGYKAPMTCIMVDNEEGLFLCNDYIVTHNTTLSMQIAYNIATLPPMDNGQEHAVLIFSLEMMEAQLVSRMISTIGRVNMQQFMDEYQHFVSDGGRFYANAYGDKFQDLMERKLTQQYERTQIALKEIKDLPIYPTTESGLSPNAIKSMVMQKKRELERKNQKLSLIVIDYLQLMVPNLGKANASRTEEVGDMSRKMKLLAKEFDVPVLLLAQLNRNADVTERPNLKDLRESGSIEQDADKVMFIWSEHADKTINDFSEYRDDVAKREALRREQQKVIISVSKNRQGETGDCQVIFDKGFQTFVSQDDEHTSGGETFEEFALKYYQMTRTEDLFWPIKVGGVSEELEAYRHLPIMEQPYLDNTGNVITMASATNKNTGMGIRSAVSKPRGGSEMSEMFDAEPVSAANAVSAAAAVASSAAKTGEVDRMKPAQPPVIDDLATGFEELGEEEPKAEEAEGASTETDEVTEAMDVLDNITLEDDDDDLDLDQLDMLNSLSDDLLK